MFSELQALIAVAENGSMERAASALYVTPSALTRRIQRLETELGLVVLDRHFKPPKLTQAGLEVLDKSRLILASLEGLKASTCGETPAVGPFRLGLSHALAEPEMSEIIIDLGKAFPLLQPSICSDVTPQLLQRLHTGDLDMAIVIVPSTTSLPHEFVGVALCSEVFTLVEARTGTRRRPSGSPDLQQRSWIVNPLGCPVREEIRKLVEKNGPMRIAAELHNPHLQLALIAGSVGLGVVQERVLRKHPLRMKLKAIDHPEFNVSAKVICVRGRNLGSRQRVAIELERILVKHFANADHHNRATP
jgi:DNA-binding transcriptional LysR family regulator